MLAEAGLPIDTALSSTHKRPAPRPQRRAERAAAQVAAQQETNAMLPALAELGHFDYPAVRACTQLL